MADAPRTKKLEPRHRDHIRRLLDPICKDRFKTNVTAFAEAIGISQPHLAQILKGGNSERGIGLNVAIAIRGYLAGIGQPMTLDELLGLDPLPGKEALPPEPKRMDEVIAKVDAIYAALPRIVQPPAAEPSPTAPPLASRRRRSSA